MGATLWRASYWGTPRAGGNVCRCRLWICQKPGRGRPVGRRTWGHQWCDRGPCRVRQLLALVILGGSGPQKGRGTGTFQETENVPMFKGITKMAVQVDSTARLPEYMAMGFRKARTGRPGPVYLDL